MEKERKMKKWTFPFGHQPHDLSQQFSTHSIKTQLTRRYVVIIENLNPKDSVVGAEAKVRYCNAGKKDDHAGIGDRGRLQEDGEKGKHRRTREESHFRPNHLTRANEWFLESVSLLKSWGRDFSDEKKAKFQREPLQRGRVSSERQKRVCSRKTR